MSERDPQTTGGKREISIVIARISRYFWHPPACIVTDYLTRPDLTLLHRFVSTKEMAVLYHRWDYKHTNYLDYVKQ